ncbi:MAG: hypothetical protein E7244_01195 [Enterocloster citroniae]|nr:hypothetical protein [Enterocloster citroniae]
MLSNSRWRYGRNGGRHWNTSGILAAVITFILVCCVSPKQIPSGSLLMLTSVPAYLVFRRMAAENKTAAG